MLDLASPGLGANLRLNDKVLGPTDSVAAAATLAAAVALAKQELCKAENVTNQTHARVQQMAEPTMAQSGASSMEVFQRRFQQAKAEFESRERAMRTLFVEQKPCSYLPLEVDWDAAVERIGSGTTACVYSCFINDAKSAVKVRRLLWQAICVGVPIRLQSCPCLLPQLFHCTLS